MIKSLGRGWTCTTPEFCELDVVAHRREAFEFMRPLEIHKTCRRNLSSDFLSSQYYLASVDLNEYNY